MKVTNRHLFWTGFAALVATTLLVWSMVMRSYGDLK